MSAKDPGQQMALCLLALFPCIGILVRYKTLEPKLSNNDNILNRISFGQQSTTALIQKAKLKASHLPFILFSCQLLHYFQMPCQVLKNRSLYKAGINFTKLLPSVFQVRPVICLHDCFVTGSRKLYVVSPYYLWMLDPHMPV